MQWSGRTYEVSYSQYQVLALQIMDTRVKAKVMIISINLLSIALFFAGASSVSDI